MIVICVIHVNIQLLFKDLSFICSFDVKIIKNDIRYASSLLNYKLEIAQYIINKFSNVKRTTTFITKTPHT